MASRIRFHGSVIIAPQRARQLVARMDRREIRGPVDADIAFPDCDIGRRVAPTRWLHPGYKSRISPLWRNNHTPMKSYP